MQDYWLMSKDRLIAEYRSDELMILNEALAPLYLIRTRDFQGWLQMRAIDEFRTNSRLLKRSLRLIHKDNISTALFFNAATITDTYWVKTPDSQLVYDDVRFKFNRFDRLALTGDADSFNQPPSRTPELTNIGSFEKCWRNEEGIWWIYKAENTEEQFTELFAYHLAKVMGIPAAHYEMDGSFIRSRDFTSGASVNFEPAYSIIGEASDYIIIFDKLSVIEPKLANDFLTMTFFDALIFNMDRHEFNYGYLRNVDSGSIISAAPLFDHNIALVTRGYPRDVQRKRDRLIDDFIELARARAKNFTLPDLTEHLVDEALDQVTVRLVQPEGLSMTPREYVKLFILNGYQNIKSEMTKI